LLLKLDMFKVPDYQQSKELKLRIKEVCKKHNKVDEAFLSLFEKRHILFLEDGTDLKGELVN